MVTITDGIMIVLGILVCFTGYSMFRGMLPVWGFILGGWIAYTIMPTILGPDRAGQLLFQLIGIGVGAIIGAAIAVPLYFVIVFLSGAALGIIFGVMVGALIDVGRLSTLAEWKAFIAMTFPPIPQSGMQYLIAAIAGILLGMVALGFQKFMICASSAFLGAAAFITGLGGGITTISSSDIGKGAIMVTAWIILGLIGLIVQFRVMGET